ncbi:mannose-1-phosphate guanylyltransferase/mannose-6-phosphate isomerase [Asaia prunellae]|uniref:mannose-1-phosphate guanylyltransferase/mannose-6-phosphate isomerase n=1 Tax=Asaia prunellae TaxID=610245 RepID=UPI00047205B5|nr:mannose-1-phosphate guanylyltransferase/mannose-6-phosphate isomerase [Asaia prunellae]
MSDFTSVVPVILSGGSGSRLWPVSRRSFPKQFWPLLSDKTLLQETAVRGIGSGLAAPVVVCNADHRFIISEQLRETEVRNAKVILEPVGRNSAPAIAAAAFITAETNPDAILWIMAADAAIRNEDLMQEALHSAVAAASEGYIVTFGIHPTKPETGYGYIEQGAELENVKKVYHVSKFIEKPTSERAVELVQNNRFSWNSGMFVARASIILQEIQQHAPEVYAAVSEAVAKRETDQDFIRLDSESFAKSPDISIDYAVAEHTTLAAVVPSKFEWSDVGSWDALWDLSPKDSDGNVTYGDVFLDGAQNCYVRSDGVVATVAGVEDLIVVVTEDAVMVSHRDRAQDVKKMVERLTAAGRPEAINHNRMYRPWGFYESLIHGDRFQVKRIHVDPGHKLSLQKHFHRAEHWVVVAGTALVTRDDDEIMVRENESIYLPLGAVHRLENPGKIPLTLIEVQSGPYLGEDDIVRIEDIYDRS